MSWTILSFGVNFGIPTVELHGVFADEASAQEAIDLQENSLLYKAVQAWTTPSGTGSPVSPFSLAVGNWLAVVSTFDGAGSPSFFLYGGFTSEAQVDAWIAGQGGRAGR